MKRLLVLGTFLAFLGIASTDAAVRDVQNPSRKKSVTVTQQRTSTSPKATQTTNKRTVSTTARTGTNPTRTATPVKAQSTRETVRSGVRTATSRSATTRATQPTSRTAKQIKTTRAAETSTEEQSVTTRTGAIYEKCKNAYFSCMDQFCMLKNDDYRRCSCNDRVVDLMELRNNLSETNTKLTEFNENLDVVGMTRGQATAMHTESDGESALTADVSASKALLQAILNSIRGDDANVGGKMSDLNSVNISMDTANAFGITDSAQVVASYNGKALYNAVYPNCRDAVKNDCNDAALQRAITAYLMAVEQDCNTVQTAIVGKQKELKAAIREGSAMLDLARVENRKKHNSSDLTTCVNEVEQAILSEEVCGANYHKCLDNGEYIDVTTGKPIAGVSDFYKLEQLLRFSEGRDASNQKLTTIASNQTFINKFEDKTKKFAQDALDKCTEKADDAWRNYLDKALVDIYYAQRSKVKEIKQGCFDFISKCYVEKEASITVAMESLIDGTTDTELVPDKIALTRTMCTDYIESCNSMFGQTNIVQEYMDLQENTDTLAACRAVAQQCFNKFGGDNYENFYDPYSGLFNQGVDQIFEYGDLTLAPTTAMDWFSLYQYDADGKMLTDNGTGLPLYKSPCAKEVAEITSCAEQIEQVFGGLDSFLALRKKHPIFSTYTYSEPTGADTDTIAHGYGWVNDLSDGASWQQGDASSWQSLNRKIRPVGVATEVYNQIIDRLGIECANARGRFVEAQYINHDRYGTTSNSSVCNITSADNLLSGYTLLTNEYICPKDYTNQIATEAWGACQCFENGARRSMNGESPKCEQATRNCSSNNCTTLTEYSDTWYQCNLLDNDNRVCPGCNTTCSISTETVQPAIN